MATFILGIDVAFLMGSALAVERQFHQHPVGLRPPRLYVSERRYLCRSRV